MDPSLGGRIECIESCSTQYFGVIGACLHEEEVSRRFPLWGGFGVLFLYLEMSEQGAETLVLEEYCKDIS